jgi:hypothetical protein
MSSILTVQGRIFEPTARGAIRRDLIEEISRVAGLTDDEKAVRLFQQRAATFSPTVTEGSVFRSVSVTTPSLYQCPTRPATFPAVPTGAG